MSTLSMRKVIMIDIKVISIKINVQMVIRKSTVFCKGILMRGIKLVEIAREIWQDVTLI